MNPCTVASRHACNVVMIEAILCATSLSLCYTATCYDINGCIGSCWYMADSKCKDSTLHIQAEQKQMQWKQPLLVCCFHDVYNTMARRIWLAGGKGHCPNWFPLLHMYSWCQSSAVDANWLRDKRVYSFHQINMSCTNTTKYNAQVLDRNPSEKRSELIYSLCPTSMLWYQSQ